VKAGYKTNAIKFIIADDHKIFREGIKFTIAEDPNLLLVGEAEDGSALLQLIEKTETDVVLLDIKMPNMDGIEATKKIHATHPDIKILILTNHDDEELILGLLKWGAHGYLLKNTEPEEIKNAIYCVHKNEYYFNDMVSNTMLRSMKYSGNSEKSSLIDILLSKRESEVLQLICRELTTHEIADKIFLSPRTIEGIRASLIEKTNVRNTAGLVVYAFKAGLIK
jgi:DNA-binding NarL/FixJ family response regulator